MPCLLVNPYALTTVVNQQLETTLPCSSLSSLVCFAAVLQEGLWTVGFLHTVLQQCKGKAWAWIPWKKVVSEASSLDIQQRRAGAKFKDMTDVFAEAAGLCSEELDLDIGDSP